MRFSRLVGNISCTNKVIELRIEAWRKYHRHIDDKGTVAIGHRITAGHLFINRRRTDIALIPVTIVRQPPPCTTTHDCVVHLGILYRRPCKATGSGPHLYGIAVLVVLVHLGELDLKRRTFILLDTEATAAIRCLQCKVAVEQSCRQCEVCSTGTETVGRHLLLTHHLIIGIAKRQCQRLTFNHLVFVAIVGSIDNSCHMNSLTRTIDSAVGEELRAFLMALVVIVVKIGIGISRPTELILISISEDIARTLILHLPDNLSLLVCGQGLQCLFAIRQFYVSPFQRLSSGSINDHIAYLILGQAFHEDTDVTDIIELSNHLCGWLCFNLYHIDTFGQAL